MKHHTFKSESALRDFLPKLIDLSCWFEVTPEPDDQWTVSVKDDVARAAFTPILLYGNINPTVFTTPDGTVLAAKDDESECGCDGCVFAQGKSYGGALCRDARECYEDRTDIRTIIWVKA